MAGPARRARRRGHGRGRDLVAPPAADANATLTLTKPIFIKMMAGTAGVKDTLMSDDLKVDGSKIDLVRFFTLIDKAPGAFQIVTR